MNIKRIDKVSVYIPTYNRAELLQKAISSVLLQNYGNIEIVVVDDASTDETQEVLHEFSKNNKAIKIIKNSSPKGAAYSRNLAIKVATGYFITGLDDDDLYSPHRITDFVNNWHDKYSFLFTNYKEFDGITITNNLPRKKTISFIDIKKRNYVGNQVFTTKAKFIESGGFDDKLEAWEDYDLWLRLIHLFGPARGINNHSYILNTEDARQRITNSSNLTLACKQFIEKHSNTLTNKEINHQKINAIYDSKYKITLKQCLLHSKDMHSTIRVIKTYLITRKSPLVKKSLKRLVALINVMK